MSSNFTLLAILKNLSIPCMHGAGIWAHSFSPHYSAQSGGFTEAPSIEMSCLSKVFGASFPRWPFTRTVEIRSRTICWRTFQSKRLLLIILAPSPMSWRRGMAVSALYILYVISPKKISAPNVLVSVVCLPSEAGGGQSASPPSFSQVAPKCPF